MSKDITIHLIKEEQKAKRDRNKTQVREYFLRGKKDPLYGSLTERRIVFLIKHFVSSKFLARYFNLPAAKIKRIATKNHCYSYLIPNFTENINARCFSKNQILRACEDFNYICPMCFRPLDIVNISTVTGHHVIPFARGGKTTKDNCLPLHVKCHFDDFKLLHSALFDSDDPIYSAKYFNTIKSKLHQKKSGIDFIIEHYVE